MIDERYDRLQVIPYNRQKAVEYAHKWAYGRNPAYYDFENIGGDCTNFASQVLFAGSGVMNFTPVYGWYYVGSFNRAASWTGVNFLYKFLVSNRGAGPFAEVVDARDVKPGDIVQLSFDGGEVFNHSPVVVRTGQPAAPDNILIAAHTYDRDNYPLTNYSWKGIRFLHIKGVRR
jgi:hypothetical protein